MFGRLLSTLLGRRDDTVPPGTGRLDFDVRPDALYAIGDVHGRLDLLQEAEARIVEDAAGSSGDRRIVMLGDYIDRGHQSAGVLDHLSAPPPPGFQRHCVLGNHEVMMLRFFFGGQHSDWLGNGGYETLRSYGIPGERIEQARFSRKHVDHLLHSYIPEEHISFLQGLNQAIGFPGYDFVHFPPAADGVDEGVRGHRVDHSFGFHVVPRPSAEKVVHGHRVVERVSLDGRYVNIDTGAYLTGRLSVLRMSAGSDPTLL